MPTTAPAFAPLDTSLPPLEELPPPALDGNISGLPLALLACATLAIGVVVGVAWHFVGLSVDVVVVNSALAGLAIGGALFYAVRATKCRRRSVAIVCAVVAALLAFGIRTVTDAFALRSAMIAGAARQMLLKNGVSPEQAQKGAEAYITPAQTLRIYTRYLTEKGVRLGGKAAARYDYGSDSDLAATTVNGGVFWILTAFEVAVAMAIAGFFAVRAATQPFFEESGEWGKRYRLVRKHPDHVYVLGELVRTRQWAEAARLPSVPAPDIRNCADVVLVRGERSGQATISIRLTEDGRGRDWFHAALPASEADEAKRIIEAKNRERAARHRRAREAQREKQRK